LQKVYEACEQSGTAQGKAFQFAHLVGATDSDAVMKNPFYTLEMPINVNGFDEKIKAIVANTTG